MFFEHIKQNVTVVKTFFLIGQVKLRDLPGKGSLLVQAMQSGIEFDGLPNVQLFEDINEKPDDPDALKILSEMESEFVKAQLDSKDAAKLYQAALAFGKKYASGEIPKRALIDLVSPMSDELCQAFGLKTSKFFSNDCKVSKDSTLRWFPDEATRVIKVYFALFRASHLATAKISRD